MYLQKNIYSETKLWQVSLYVQLFVQKVDTATVLLDTLQFRDQH